MLPFRRRGADRMNCNPLPPPRWLPACHSEIPELPLWQRAEKARFQGMIRDSSELNGAWEFTSLNCSSCKWVGRGPEKSLYLCIDTQQAAEATAFSLWQPCGVPSYCVAALCSHRGEWQCWAHSLRTLEQRPGDLPSNQLAPVTKAAKEEAGCWW